jgi:hypothetical protein
LKHDNKKKKNFAYIDLGIGVQKYKGVVGNI